MFQFILVACDVIINCFTTCTGHCRTHIVASPTENMDMLNIELLNTLYMILIAY